MTHPAQQSLRELIAKVEAIDAATTMIEEGVRGMAKSDCDGGGFLERNDAREIAREVIEAVCPTLLQSLAATPIKMILHCPACGLQHIDEPSPPIGVEPTTGDGGLVMWTNPPHRSHLCHGCGHIWRPADVATEGVARIETVGKADSPRVDPQASLTALTVWEWAAELQERGRQSALSVADDTIEKLDRIAALRARAEAAEARAAAMEAALEEVRVRAYTWSGPGIRYTDPVDRPNCSVKSVRYNIVVRLKAGK